MSKSKATGKLNAAAIYRSDGSTVSVAGVVGVAATVAALFVAYSSSYENFIPVLDHANLAFHEAGHLFFGALGATAGLYGGTFGTTRNMNQGDKGSG